jgi:hypothetical protein
LERWMAGYLSEEVNHDHPMLKVTSLQDLFARSD